MTRAHTSLIDWAAQAAAFDVALVPERSQAEAWQLRLHEAVKRGLDVTVAAFVLLLASPVLLLAMAAVALTSRGPVIFRQLRAGKDGKPFTIYKLRTMRNGASDERDLYEDQNELDGAPVFKIRKDPRITRIGRLLRRSSIDELPQLVNVLRGEMSIVGPRPLPLDEIRHASWGEQLRLSVKPGLTCLWQIAGRTEIPYREWMQLDGYYVQNRSLALDLRIMLKTIPAVLSGRGAY